MFMCPVTKRCTKPGAKQVKVVTEKREKLYTKKLRNLETGEIDTVVIGRGWEIAKEMCCSEEGAKIYMAAHPELFPVKKENNQD